ncbi:MAG: DUF1211 domain-containing protein [Austwickia sp.]|nr:DUF1211 domain-containing protein [Austwickia sp.]MBK9102105.1 DUF1211 domain-containing protein [Austwickia sp.]
MGAIWVQHHRRFRAIVRYDQRLQVLNLGLLLGVALGPCRPACCSAPMSPIRCRT